jgi:hypothetical protein
MMTINLLFASLLTLAPPETTDLDAATQSILEVSAPEAIARLEQSLAAVTRDPQSLLGDPTAADRIDRARLALVWAYLADGRKDAATKAMDEAIRSAMNRPLPLSGLGPEVRQLHEDRRHQLERAKPGTIAVDCENCQLLVNETRSANPSSPLLLGSYRVWTFDPDGNIDPMYSEVTLEAPGQTVTLVFREPEKIEERQSDSLRPKVPRWAKILGMVAGAGMVVGGGLLLSRDGKCKNGDTPTSENVTACQDIWTSKPGGIALMGIGAGVFMGATVWLTVDEVRVNRSRHAAAMVAWTIRF